MIQPEEFKILETTGEQFIHPDGDKVYEIVLRVTDACNYNCEYCHWNTGPTYKYEDVISSVDMATDILSDYNFRFYFHGGEPTVHPRLQDILTHVFSVKDNITIELQTNLSKPKPYFEHLVSTFADDQLEINATYHPTQVSDFDDFIDKLDYLHDCSVLGKVDVMLDHNIDMIGTVLVNSNHILEKPYAPRTEFIHGYIDYENTTNSYKSFVDSRSMFHERYEVLHHGETIPRIHDTNDLFMNGINFKGWLCEAGNKYIILNGNGDYFKCASSTLDAPVGNILTNSTLFKLHTSNLTKCKWSSCKGEFYLEKYKQ